MVVDLPLANYRLWEKLASGGMGEVYLAQRYGAKEPCVVKRLLPVLHAHGVARSRFRREAQLATILSHPRIVGAVDVQVVDDDVYLAFPYVPSIDLETLLCDATAGEAIDVSLVVAIAQDVLTALVYAHDVVDAEGKALEFVHRDLSTRNILLTFEGDARVIDFGVSHAEVDDYRTANGVLIGTPAYASPEQARGESVDRRSDLYSLSVVLWSCLEGRELVTGPSLPHILHAVESLPAPPLTRPVPSALADALARCLSKDREHRFQNADEYLSAIRDLEPMPREKIRELLRHRYGDEFNAARAHVDEAQRYYEEEWADAGKASLTVTAHVPGPSFEPLAPRPARGGIASVGIVMAAVALAIGALWFSRNEDRTAAPPTPVAPPVTASVRPRAAPVPATDSPIDFAPLRKPDPREARTVRGRSPSKTARAVEQAPPASPDLLHPLRRRLSAFERKQDTSGQLDPVALGRFLDEIEVVGASSTKVIRAVDAARVCLSACTTQEKLQTTREALEVLGRHRAAASAETP